MGSDAGMFVEVVFLCGPHIRTSRIRKKCICMFLFVKLCFVCLPVVFAYACVGWFLSWAEFWKFNELSSIS